MSSQGSPQPRLTTLLLTPAPKLPPLLTRWAGGSPSLLYTAGSVFTHLLSHSPVHSFARSFCPDSGL